MSSWELGDGGLGMGSVGGVGSVGGKNIDILRTPNLILKPKAPLRCRTVTDIVIPPDIVGTALGAITGGDAIGTTTGMSHH